MRKIAGIVGVWAVGFHLAAAIGLAQAPAEPPPLGAEAPKADPSPTVAPETNVEAEKARKLDALLARWEEKSAAITSLDATFRRVDRKSGKKDPTTYEGRLLLKGSRLACLGLEKIEPNPDPQAKVKKSFHQRLICTGKEIVLYDGPTRRITVFPTAGEEARDCRPLPWPAPFLFGVEADQLKARYHIKLIQEGRDATRIEFSPREFGLGNIDDFQNQVEYFLFFAGQGVDFTEAVLDLDRETSLPKALMLTTSGKKSQTFVFKETKVNPTIAAENFAFKKLDGWKVVRNPDPNVRPNKVAAKPRKVEAEGDAKEPDRPR